ncbi:MAG TPA: matrixin family metalloprotease [Candidatus Binatia bacterium]|nr:matrixin family metalloprotease [Candidatus Binatia bacterium]
MNKNIQRVIALVALSGLAYYVYAYQLMACSQTLSYDIGNIDPRFGITEEDFVKLAQDTELVWETPFAKEFFRYDPNAKFKVNLVFDDRQQRTIDEKNSRSEIDSQNEAYRQKVSNYELLLSEQQAANESYDAAMAAYEARLAKYNEQVDYWNENGGAPSREYTALQREKASLQQEARRLENQRSALNAKVTQLNALAAEINVTAKNLNYNVDAYNGKFGTSREFDQGSYTGDAINIYQFNTNEDLKLVLAHEFGHALGLDHIDEPEAIMYYLMDEQNIENLALSEADMNTLKSNCHIK